MTSDSQLITDLENDARENASMADQCIHAPKAKAFYAGMANRCREAARLLRDQRETITRMGKRNDQLFSELCQFKVPPQPGCTQP